MCLLTSWRARLSNCPVILYVFHISFSIRKIPRWTANFQSCGCDAFPDVHILIKDLICIFKVPVYFLSALVPLHAVDGVPPEVVATCQGDRLALVH